MDLWGFVLLGFTHGTILSHSPTSTPPHQPRFKPSDQLQTDHSCDVEVSSQSGTSSLLSFIHPGLWQPPALGVNKPKSVCWNLRWGHLLLPTVVSLLPVIGTTGLLRWLPADGLPAPAWSWVVIVRDSVRDKHGKQEVTLRVPLTPCRLLLR